MTNRLVTMIEQRRATLTNLQGELADLEKARVLLTDGEPDWPAFAALWQRSGAAHVVIYRASKNGKMYRRLVLYVGAGASTEELLALRGDLGGTLTLAPRRRWIATGALAKWLCQGMLPHVEGSWKEQLRDLLATETSGCVSPKVIKAATPSRPIPQCIAPPKPTRARLPRAIPATPTPVREAPAPPPAQVVQVAKKDPVPSLGHPPPQVAPQRGPWCVVDAQGAVLAQGLDRHRMEELAEVVEGRVVPAGQVVK